VVLGRGKNSKEKQNKMADHKKRKLQGGVKEEGHNNLRVRLYEDELELVNNLRSLWNEAVDLGQDPRDVKHGWVKSKAASIFVKNPDFEGQLTKVKKFKDEICEIVKEHSPKYPTIKREKSNDSHLLVVDPADCHIGKLASSFETGEEYNSQIAVQRVRDGVKGILDKSSGFNIDKILFIGGNDILHVDNPKSSTTSGTTQDTSGMWYDNFLTAKRLYIEVLESLISIADVHFVFNPSNHDFISGFMLSDVIKTWFRNCENITFDCSMSHRKGYLYHKNLIGTTHGDGAKTQDLPLLMATEFPLEWANSNHRYVYTHHVHHKTSKDYAGVTVESLRSPSSADGWHHRNGYQHAPKAIEGFIHHKNHGQVARLTHIF
jgi:hypothetical protein